MPGQNVCIEATRKTTRINTFLVRSLDVRPAVLEAKLVPGVPVASVSGFAAALLLGQGVVVVVEDGTEVLVEYDATLYRLVNLFFLGIEVGVVTYGPPGP